MSMTSRLVTGALIGNLCFFAFSACQAKPRVAEPTQSTDYEKLVKCPNALFTRFGRLSCVVPEFGGAFTDDSGILCVYLTDSSVSLRAKEAIRREFEIEHKAMPAVRFVEAKYSYGDFESFLRKLRPHLDTSTVGVSMDDRIHRLRIKLESVDARDRVERALDLEGIPRGAVLLEVGNQ
jgi:hypothetical protein